MIRTKYKKSEIKLLLTVISKFFWVISFRERESSKDSVAIFPCQFIFFLSLWQQLKIAWPCCRYFGLSSTGISYKSTAASYGSSGLGSSDYHRGTRDSERFSDSYNEEDKDTYKKSVKKENQGDDMKKSPARLSRLGFTTAICRKLHHYPSAVWNLNTWPQIALAKLVCPRRLIWCG